MREDSGIKAFLKPIPDSTATGFKLVKELPETLEPRMLYCVLNYPEPGENLFATNEDGTKATQIKLQAVPVEVETPLLTGHWHHGNGVLVSGSIRIARADFDTNPPQTFQNEMFDWICKTLNKEIDLYYANRGDRDAGS